MRWEVIYMDAKKYVLRLLEDLEHVTSSEEREAFDSSWRVVTCRSVDC